MVFDGGEVQVLRQFGCRHGALQVLLVGKYQHLCSSEVLQWRVGSVCVCQGMRLRQARMLTITCIIIMKISVHISNVMPGMRLQIQKVAKDIEGN